MTKALHDHIQSQEFRDHILEGMKTYQRIRIGTVLDSRIEKATCAWQQANIEEMFDTKVMKKLTEKIINIQESLHTIKNKMKGFIPLLM